MQTQINEMEFGVELTKFYEEEEYHLPSVVYEFTSKRPYPVLVRVVETIPDDIDPQHIGFHKDSARDDWKLTDDTLVFETEIAGRSEYKTVYAVYPDTEYDVEQLVTPPDKFTVEQAAAVSRSHSDSDTFTRSSSSPPNRETERADESIPTLSLRETDDDSETDSEDDSGEGPDSGGEADASARVSDVSATLPAEDGVKKEEDDEVLLVDQFVAELRAEEASADSLAYLEERFGAVAEPDKSVEVRIDQLQNDVADLRSYRNAFEDFLGEHGSPEAVVDRFEDRLEAFDTTLESVETRVEEQEGSLTAVRSDQEEIRSEIDTMTQVIWRTMKNLQELSTDVDRLDEQVADIDMEERIGEIEDDLEQMASVFDALQEAFQD